MGKLKKSHKSMICVLVISLLCIGIFQIVTLVDIYNYRLVGDEIQQYKYAKNQYYELYKEIYTAEGEIKKNPWYDDAADVKCIQSIQETFEKMKLIEFPNKYKSLYNDLLSTIYDYHVIQKEKFEEAKTDNEYFDILREYIPVNESINVLQECLIDAHYVSVNTINYDSPMRRVLLRLPYTLIGFVIVYFGYHLLKKLLKRKKT